MLFARAIAERALASRSFDAVRGRPLYDATMGPTAMLTLIFAGFAMFTWSASRRWHLLQIGRPAGNRLDHFAARLRGTWRYAFRQEKMDYYNPAGLAHKLIFAGFVVLLFRTLVLWGRGFYAPFNLFVLGADAAARRRSYEFVKDIMAVARHRGHARVLLLPRRSSREADDAVAGRGSSSSASSSR